MGESAHQQTDGVDRLLFKRWVGRGRPTEATAKQLCFVRERFAGVALANIFVVFNYCSTVLFLQELDCDENHHQGWGITWQWWHNQNCKHR